MIKMKKRNIYLNTILTILIITATVAWMITSASRGEIVDYTRHAIITAVDIDVEIYQLIDDEYVLVTDVIDLTNLAPGDKKVFRFDITNNNNNVSTSKIIFSDITGDIEDLKDVITIGSSSPKIFEYKLSEKLEISNEKNIFRFDSGFPVEPHTKKSIYWYISLDSSASNEIVAKTLTINNISFIRP